MDIKLKTIYGQIPKAVCPQQCGMCCGPVFPSRAELRNIWAWCRQKHIEYKDFLDISAEGRCPYLTADKRCLIYPVRPFLCRMLGASTECPCPIHKCRASKLLNKPQSGALYKAIYLQGKEKRRTEKHRRIVRQALEGLPTTNEGLGVRI